MGNESKNMCIATNESQVQSLRRQIGDKTDHNISCRRSFLIPWKIALRVVVLLSSCRRVLRFVVI